MLKLSIRLVIHYLKYGSVPLPIRRTRLIAAIALIHISILQRLNVRRSAAEALGKIGSERAIDGLLKLVEDSDFNVRRSAAEALGKIGSERAIDGLLKLVEDSDSDVRGRAAQALGKIGSERAIDGLLKLVEDSDSDVRWSAAEALGKSAKKHTDAIAQYLPHLLTLIPSDSGSDALSVILAIQQNCKYYNYEIWHEAIQTPTDRN
jgi:HEAT repeat protein